MRWLIPNSLQPGFPDLDETAEHDMPVAVGGDLSVKRLLLAYKQGIFPWFTDDNLILWWSPDPRTVLFPQQFKPTRSLKKSARNRGYTVTLNQAFEQTIFNCSARLREPGASDPDTWITRGMIDAYCELNRAGYAHSVETWLGGDLVGGLYGVSIGKVFFGESMFSKSRDSSKVALLSLVNHLVRCKFQLIDCQQATHLMFSLGAVEIARKNFLELIQTGVSERVPDEVWRDFPSESEHD